MIRRLAVWGTVQPIRPEMRHNTRLESRHEQDVTDVAEAVTQGTPRSTPRSDVTGTPREVKAAAGRHTLCSIIVLATRAGADAILSRQPPPPAPVCPPRRRGQPAAPGSLSISAARRRRRRTLTQAGTTLVSQTRSPSDWPGRRRRRVRVWSASCARAPSGGRNYGAANATGSHREPRESRELLEPLEPDRRHAGDNQKCRVGRPDGQTDGRGVPGR